MSEATPYILESKNGQYLDTESSAIMYKLMDLNVHQNMYYTYDDIGTATLIADIYDNNIRYCADYRAWYIWDGIRWKRQPDEGIMSDKVQDILNLLKLYCDEKEHDGEDITEYRKYIKSIRKNVAIKNIMEILKTQVRIRPEEMDTDPYILNLPGVAYNLKTGEPVEAPQEKYITMVTNARLYSFAEPCERWQTFINEIMSYDEQKAAFLQRALGYSLLGTNRDECMFVAYGSKTRNGKGTLFYAIEKALGSDYYGTASPDLICELGNGKRIDINAPQPGLSKLVGKRLCVMSEADRDHRIDVATVKYYTGRDTVTTRGLYEKPFDFTPQFTMWLETNYLPAVTDDSIFRSDRIWIIPFDETFSEGNRDTDLKEIFSDPDNRPTIMKWLFDGCMDYMRQGLNPPQVVRDATDKYRKRHDRIGMFLEKKCRKGAEREIERSKLYAAYRTWCCDIENKFKPVGSTSFYQEMEMRGYFVTRKHTGFFVQGIDLAENDEKETV